MSRTRTLAQLRAEVRQRADIENSQHISDSEVNRYVNQSCAALHALIAESDEDYLYTSTDYTTTAGVGSITVTAYYRIQHVEAQINGQWRSLRRWRYDQRDTLTNAGIGWSTAGATPLYRYGQGKIMLLPTPDSAYTVRVHGVASFADMSSDASTFEGEDGWEEWVVLDAAIKCLVKEESDPSALMAERERVERRVRAQITTRDHGSPATAVDVEEGRVPWRVI